MIRKLIRLLDKAGGWWDHLQRFPATRPIAALLAGVVMAVWSWLSSQPVVVSVAAFLAAGAFTAAWLTYLPALTKKWFAPPIDVEMRAALTSAGRIAIHVVVVNHSRSDRVALEFSFGLVDQSGKGYWIMNPDSLGDLRVSLGPQEATEGVVAFSWQHAPSGLELSSLRQVLVVRDLISRRRMEVSANGIPRAMTGPSHPSSERPGSFLNLR